MTIDNSAPNEFELSGLAAILPPEVTCLLRDQQRLIKELSERITRLEEKLERTEAKQEAQQGETDHLREETALERAYDRQRISKLENRNKTVTSATGTAYIDKLHKLMLQSGIRHISITNAAKLLSISRMHAHRLKPSLLADSRFAIVKDPHHKQRHLIRMI